MTNGGDPSVLAAYRWSLNSNKGIGINEPFPPDHRDGRCGVVCGAPTFGAEQAAASQFRGDAAKDNEANDGCDARGLAA